MDHGVYQTLPLSLCFSYTAWSRHYSFVVLMDAISDNFRLWPHSFLVVPHDFMANKNFLILKVLSTRRASGPFFGYDDAQQLVLKTLGCDHEVEQRHFGGDLWQVVRVAQLRRDVEAEVLAVLDHSLPQTNHLNTTWLQYKRAPAHCTVQVSKITFEIQPKWKAKNVTKNARFKNMAPNHKGKKNAR